MPTQLVVMAGLPGSGKSRLGRLVADSTGATFLRIDTLEAAITSALHPFDGPAGYLAAEWVAEDQLRSGRDVVVDAVNAVEEARAGWRGLAERTGSRLHFVEVTCSDPVEHRRRVESRSRDWPGQGLPTWAEVRGRSWQPFAEERLVVDNVGDPERGVRLILEHLSAGAESH